MARTITSPPESTPLAQWAYTEMQRLADVVDALEQGARIVFYNAPKKPRAGQIFYADGTSWNPGSGEGTYEYRSDGLYYKL